MLHGWLTQRYPQPVTTPCYAPSVLWVGASFHADGECGDPKRQTCSKVPKDAFAHQLAARTDLFADYTKGYTDELGQPHALCAGLEKCCGGGVWGDAIPAGTWLRLDHGVPACSHTTPARLIRA